MKRKVQLEVHGFIFYPYKYNSVALESAIEVCD